MRETLQPYFRSITAVALSALIWIVAFPVWLIATIIHRGHLILLSRKSEVSADGTFPTESIAMEIRRHRTTVVLLAHLAMASILIPPRRTFGQEVRAPQPMRDWTVIHYVAGDNDGDAFYGESLKPLKLQVGNAPGLNWVMFIDLAKGQAKYDDVFGEDFDDARIYELQPSQFVRRSGGDVMPSITTTSKFEANSGDAATLRDFIRYAKTYYPARHYALIILSHGWCRAMAPDEDEDHVGDALYPAEITDVLSSDESVDLLVLDVCQFASVETMYQWRPGNGRFSARWMVASPPLSSSPNYGDLVNRITGGLEKNQTSVKAQGQDEQNLKLEEAESKDLGRLVLGSFARYNARECWGLYDLAEAGKAKAALDRLAQAAAGNVEVRREFESIRGTGRNRVTLNYFADEPAGGIPVLSTLLIGLLASDERAVAQAWVTTPHFDLYDFGRRVSDSQELPQSVRDAGKNVANAADGLVAQSFAGKQMWPGFVPGKHGAFFVFPDGTAKLEGNSHWELMKWYTGADLRPQLAEHLATRKRLDNRAIEKLDPEQRDVRRKERKGRQEFAESPIVKPGYGRLSWVIDGAANKDDSVGNWFELLNGWYGRSGPLTPQVQPAKGLNGLKE